MKGGREREEDREEVWRDKGQKIEDRGRVDGEGRT